MQLFRKLALAALGIPALFAQTAPATTQVLATLTVKDGIVREELTKNMPAEVRATVQLYLDGKIQQWFARSDGKGVVFLLNCKTVDEARAITDTLPLIKGKLASFEFMPLGPLTPLRILMSPPAQ